jgi:FkbM family methyltransferase
MSQTIPPVPIKPEERAATLELFYLRDLLTGLPADQRTALDVGAHRGHVSVMLARLGFSVLAVEPNPLIADQLDWRLEELGLAGYGPDARTAGGRVRLARCAASDRNGWDGLLVGSASTVCSLERAWATDAFPDAFRQPRTVPVPVRRLDELAPEYGLRQIGFLKVDVEGHEQPALRGYFAAGRLPPPAVVMFEANEHFPEAAGACLGLLAEQGYETFDVIVRAGVGLVEAARFGATTVDVGWLPAAWGPRAGTYANFIAYHSTLAATLLPDPAAFIDPWAEQDAGRAAVAA